MENKNTFRIVAFLVARSGVEDKSTAKAKATMVSTVHRCVCDAIENMTEAKCEENEFLCLRWKTQKKHP